VPFVSQSIWQSAPLLQALLQFAPSLQSTVQPVPFSAQLEPQVEGSRTEKIVVTVIGGAIVLYVIVLAVT
jgi:hypothetical protein